MVHHIYYISDLRSNFNGRYICLACLTFLVSDMLIFIRFLNVLKGLESFRRRSGFISTLSKTDFMLSTYCKTNAPHVSGNKLTKYPRNDGLCG